MAIFFMPGFYTDMKNNNVSQLSFKSNIRFVPYERYRNLLFENIGKIDIVQEMNNIKEVKKIKNLGVTQKIMYCISGILKDLTEKNDFIYHWTPRFLYAGQNKTDTLIEIGKKLKEFLKTHKTQGFAIGGLSKKSINYEKKLSKNLLDFLMRKLKPEEKNKYTIFFGQNNNSKDVMSPMPYSSFSYSPKHDTYYVNCRVFDSLKKDYVDLELTKEKIRDHFDYIHIGDDDKVFIGIDDPEAIPNEFWNKNKINKAA